LQKINLLVTLDQNYILPLKVMLSSIFSNHVNVAFDVYMVYSDIPPQQIEEISEWVRQGGSNLIPVEMDNDLFSDAPISGRYTKAMYYRLLAYEILPENLDRILYLDPDILVINPLDSLYETDLTGYLFAAASHTALTQVTSRINRLRLNTYDMPEYYNSGVLLMNLALQRNEMNSKDIFFYVQKNKNKLILPDQDILNGLYWDRIKPLDDSIYNFDARKSNIYYLLSSGLKDVDWIMDHTVILHFCGRQKPWNKGYVNKFSVLYKHYQKQLFRNDG